MADYIPQADGNFDAWRSHVEDGCTTAVSALRCVRRMRDGRKTLLTEQWHTDALTPTRKAKPAGVMGAGKHRAAHVSKRFRSGDPAPVDPNELTFLSLDTRTPYTTDYAGTDANKVAHYMLRWVNTRGDKGPWSETASATIGA